MIGYYISHNDYSGYFVAFTDGHENYIVFTGSIEECNAKCIELNECRDYNLANRSEAVDEDGEDAVRKAEEKAEKKETAAARKKPARSR